MRKLATVALLLGLVALSACGPAPEPTAEVVETAEPAPDPRTELITEDGLPGEAYAALTDDGAWCWFGDPRAVFLEGEFRRTYAGWVNSAGDVEVAQYDHDTGVILATDVKAELQKDDHASPALLVRPDGRFMVFYSGHRGRWMIYRISSGAEDVTAWGKEYAASGHTSDATGYTYPNPAILEAEGGTRYLFWRGTGYLPMFSVSETGMTWSEPRALVDGGGERPYLKLASDGESTIHFALTDDHPRGNAANSVYYVCYRDSSYLRADGSLVCEPDSLPFTLSSADAVYDAEAEGAPAWVWDVAYDGSGRPVVVFATFPAESDHRYHYARWDGTAWQSSELTAAGGWFPSIQSGRRLFEPNYSGGMALDHTDPSVVYLSRPVDGVFEIERWTTADGGETWTVEAVTSGSAENNVRPVVPLNHASEGPGLLWMHGPYVDYTDYGTSLRMK